MIGVLLLFAAVVGLLAIVYRWRGSIPTPVPSHIAKLASRANRGSVWKSAYRLLLVIVFFTVVLGTLAINPNGLWAFLAFAVIAALVLDDLEQTARDIWNGDFWEVDP